MTSKEVIQFIQTDGVDKLYKKFENCFQIIDKWSDTFIEGDLLDENNLSYALDQSTGCFAKLCPVANALEAYMDRLLYNEEAKHYKTLTTVRAQDTSVAKANARANVSDIREYLSDFKSYVMVSQQNIVSAQSRLKRLSVESGAKGIDFKGDKSNIPTEEKAWGK